MTRYKDTENGRVPFTAAENAEADQREAAWAAGEGRRLKDAANAPILAQIEAIDMKRIRPLAEGDGDYLAILNAQIAALRASLQK